MARVSDFMYNPHWQATYSWSLTQPDSRRNKASTILS